MRVLAVGTFYPPHALGGYERIWKDAVRSLRDAGHEVRVLCSDWTGVNNGEDEDPDIRRELRVYLDDLLDVRSDDRATVVEREKHNAQVLESTLADFGPDVVFLGPVFGLPLSVLTKIRDQGVRQLAFIGDEWPKDAPKADPGQQLLGWTARLFGRTSREGVEGRRFHYADVDQWVCASDRAADLVRRSGADPSTVTVLRPGPDRRRFERRDAKPWRGELLCAGPLLPKKGIEHAIRALTDAPGYKLTIAGAGDPRYADELRGIAAELGVEDRVRMLGEQRERMPELYADADAVIVPSVWREAWALVPLEAMAVGRPVVATAVGGAAEYLRDDVNSLVVRPGDPVAIARAVDRLAKDDVLHARVVQGGFATADEYRYDRFLDGLAGAVVALGETPGEKSEEETVSEPHEQEPAAQTDEDEEPAQREPEAVGAVSSVQGRFPGVQGQPISTARPEPEPETAAEPEAAMPEPVGEAAPEPGTQKSEPETVVAPLSDAKPEPEPEAKEPEVTEPEPGEPEPEAVEPEPEVKEPEPEARQPEPEAKEPEAKEPDSEAPEEEVRQPEPEPSQPSGSTPPPVAEPSGPPQLSVVAAAAEDAPEAEEWLPEGYEPPEPEPEPEPTQTTEWEAIVPEPDKDEPAPETAASSAPEPAVASAPVSAVTAASPSPQDTVGLVSRLAALEARIAELSSSAISGIERNASELATLEGRVGELANRAVSGVERNASELTAAERRVGDLASTAAAGVERTANELAALEQRVTEIAESAVSGVERNASQLATIDTRLSELAATAATAREHQGSELGSLQTRVGELAAFAELRGEALGQRIDDLERTLKEAVQRLEAIDQRLSTLDGRLEGVESATESLAGVPERLDRVESVAGEMWQREQTAAEQQRAASEGLEKLKGLAKLNDASFEQLRALGLSGTQAARLLAAREARSGFDSVEELESVPGFPPALITELKQLVES